MIRLTDRAIALGSAGIAFFALIISAAAFVQSRAQYVADYDEDVTLKVDQWPLDPISSEIPSEFNVEVRNTSKQNLEYKLRLTGNAICVSEDKAFDSLKPCEYESRPVRISKPEAGSHFHLHKLYVKTLPGAVKVNPLAYSSEPDYFVTLQVVNARNGNSLLKTTCYYTYIPERSSLSLYRPIIDTSGRSKTLQARCM